MLDILPKMIKMPRPSKRPRSDADPEIREKLLKSIDSTLALLSSVCPDHFWFSSHPTVEPQLRIDFAGVEQIDIPEARVPDPYIYADSDWVAACCMIVRVMITKNTPGEVREHLEHIDKCLEQNMYPSFDAFHDTILGVLTSRTELRQLYLENSMPIRARWSQVERESIHAATGLRPCAELDALNTLLAGREADAADTLRRQATVARDAMAAGVADAAIGPRSRRLLGHDATDVDHAISTMSGDTAVHVLKLVRDLQPSALAQPTPTTVTLNVAALNPATHRDVAARCAIIQRGGGRGAAVGNRSRRR